jgi:hypothetical protein
MRQNKKLWMLLSIAFLLLVVITLPTFKEEEVSLPKEQKETTENTPLLIAKQYLNAYINQDWDTVHSLCADDSFDETVAKSYKLVNYSITSTKEDSDPHYYHVYITLTNEAGMTFSTVADNPLEVLLVREDDSTWKPLTWYFFP